MALNPQYEPIGKAFTQQYYAWFDDPTQRHQLAGLYNVICKIIQCFFGVLIDKIIFVKKLF